MAVPRTQSVLENECRDAKAVEVFSNLRAFVQRREPSVAAARAHHNTRPGRLSRIGEIHGQGWFIHILLPRRARCSFGIQDLRLWIGRKSEGRCKQQKYSHAMTPDSSIFNVPL